jgi:hypothetical protein
MQVRFATPKDFLYIMDMYWSMLDELGESDMNEVSMLTHVINCYKKAPCILLVDDDIICGMIGLTIVTAAHNGAGRLTEYCVYIYPRYRNLRNFSLLVEKSKEFAKNLSLPLQCSFVSESSEKVKRKLLKILGFEIISLTGVYNGS